MQQQPPSSFRFLAAIGDAFRQPDLRWKLLFTFGLLVIFRFVANVPMPGADLDILDRVFEDNQLLGFLNIFSGGALQNLSVASMGVYPYITASIIMQLLVPVIPRLQAISREGEYGRQKINQYTHWLTIPLAMAQGYGQLVLLQRSGVISGIGLGGGELFSTIAMVLSLAAGTMFLVWLGELITEKGIGNGISLIIFGGIVASLPRLVDQYFLQEGITAGIIFTVVIGVLVVYAIVFFNEAQRRIPVQYGRSLFRGGRMYRQAGIVFHTDSGELGGDDPPHLCLFHHDLPGHRRQLFHRRRKFQPFELCQNGARPPHPRPLPLLGPHLPPGSDLHLLLHDGNLPAAKPRRKLAKERWLCARHQAGAAYL